MEYFDIDSPWQKVDLHTWDALIRPEYLTVYPADFGILWQGQVNSFIYIVKSGRVVMRVTSRDGREKIMMFAEKGGLFGEIGAFENHIQPQPYSAVTLVDSQIYKIPLSVFKDKLQADQQLTLAVITILSRKTSLHISQVLGLSFGDIRYRVAGILLYLITTYGVPAPHGIQLEVPFTHQDVADLIKSSRVSVSKILKEFTVRGILKKKNQRYVIYDIKQLEDIVRTV
ncbi:Crp/Fnr family transcriptional regulator [Oscillospiraceae bacterium PP1C4]